MDLFSWFANYLTSEYTDFWIFKFMYHIFLLVLSLPSTSAVVYTIACVYTTKEIIFNKVTGILPTVWKKLMITFVWTLVIMFLYDVLTFLVLYMLIDIILVIMIIFYAIGFVYISVIWHLASVVSLLEESYGYKASLKSKALIKGIGVTGKVCLGIICLLLLSILIHLSLVIQTVVYFVCKSYHHENIDKSCLGEHLEAYNLRDYVPPIRNKDIQLEQYEVLIESTP
ncbi:hypothetical protein MKW92_025147 [Papaver armeniacum]|nr:hypothetical protein MKW92_025147 [Papaver armeniacum]